MVDKKISELTNITGANLADNDEFVVVDTSEDVTKAITYGELKGAIVERGNNANGSYARWPDGTQICWNDNFSTISVGAAVWTYPASFNVGEAAPAILATVRFSGARIVSAAPDGAGAISASIYTFDSSGGGASPPVYLMAIGRWF